MKNGAKRERDSWMMNKAKVVSEGTFSASCILLPTVWSVYGRMIVHDTSQIRPLFKATDFNPGPRGQATRTLARSQAKLPG